MEPASARARKGARAVVASVVLGACAYGIVDTASDPAGEPDAEPEEASRPDAWPDAESPTAPTPCDQRRKIVTIVVDGAPTQVEIYVACDPRPYRELGDPPP